MRIDSTIRPGNLSQVFKKHLQFVDAFNVRASVVIAILILYDLPLLLGLLNIMKVEFLWINIPAITILHLWGIRLLIKNPYSTQFEMVRFIGILGVLGAITFCILSLGMSYFTLDISSSWYYIVVILSILIVSFTLMKFQIDKYSGDPTKEFKVRDQSKYAGLLAVAPAIGYMLAQSTKDSSIQFFITLLVLYFITVLYIYIAAKFIHKYYFMKINIDFVHFQTPTKKEYKELIKKGVDIK